MTADYYINQLNLIPHKEGGWYSETYKSSVIIPQNQLCAKFSGQRFSASLIYYLLQNNEQSHFHRLLSDELWIFNKGEVLRIYIIDEQGLLSAHLLGDKLEKGEKMQILVPANTWFAAELVNENSFCLLSCMVTPGFEYSDFELANKQTMLKEFPQHNIIINQLCY